MRGTLSADWPVLTHTNSKLGVAQMKAPEKSGVVVFCFSREVPYFAIDLRFVASVMDLQADLALFLLPDPGICAIRSTPARKSAGQYFASLIKMGMAC